MKLFASLGLWPRLLLVVFCGAGLVAMVFWIRESELEFERSKLLLESIGQNTLVIQSLHPTLAAQGAETPRPGTTRRLTVEDIEELKKAVPNAELTARCYELSKMLSFTASGQTVEVIVFGCGYDLSKALNLELANGLFLSALELENVKDSKTCVLSAEMAEKLLPSDNLSWNSIRIKDTNSSFQVLGVLKPRPASPLPSPLNHDKAMTVFIPHRIFASEFMANNAEADVLNHVAFKFKDQGEIDGAIDALKAAINRLERQECTELISPKSMHIRLIDDRMGKRWVQLGWFATASLFTLLVVVYATYAEGPREAENVNASRGSRLRATLFDTLISVAVGLIAAIPLYSSERLRNEFTAIMSPTTYLLTGFGIYLIIHGYPIYAHGQSWGKRLCHIVVVDRKTGRKVGLVRYFMRELIKVMFGFVQFVFRYSFLSTLDLLFIFSRSRRCLHDWISLTSVVKTRKPVVSSDDELPRTEG